MYNKLFTKILDSTIWLEPDHTRIVWITLLAAMDEDGFVEFPSIKVLAHRAIVSVEDAEAAIATLSSPDPHSGSSEHEGRRIEVVQGGFVVINAKKYRSLSTREKKRAQTAERVRRHREKKQCNAHVTQCNDFETPSEAYTKAKANVHPCTVNHHPDDLVAHSREKQLPERAPKKNRSTPATIDITTRPDAIDDQTALAFIDHRKAIKKPLTQHAFDLAMQEAMRGPEIGMSPNDVINASIRNGWQGVNIDWLRKSQPRIIRHPYEPMIGDTSRMKTAVELMDEMCPNSAPAKVRRAQKLRSRERETRTIDQHPIVGNNDDDVWA